MKTNLELIKSRKILFSRLREVISCEDLIKGNMAFIAELNCLINREEARTLRDEDED